MNVFQELLRPEMSVWRYALIIGALSSVSLGIVGKHHATGVLPSAIYSLAAVINGFFGRYSSVKVLKGQTKLISLQSA